MKVQEYLREGGTLAQLTEDLGIKVVEHPTDPLVILTYSQIDSPKLDPVVKECRGLVLEKGTWRTVGRAFSRFYNLGEVPALDSQFDWSDFCVDEKCDGSLIIWYRYNDTERVNTRGSFGQGQVCDGAWCSWSELFYSIIDWECIQLQRNASYSYVFEMCSTFNKVVRHYPDPTLFLLTVIDNETGEELPDEQIDSYAEYFCGIEPGQLKVKRPTRYHFSSVQEILDYLKTIDDATFEGFVLRDKNGMRIKVKNPKYVALHHLKGEGNNLFSPKYLLPFILDNSERDEVLNYFPECTDAYWGYSNALNFEKALAYSSWEESKHLDGQKEFALAVKDHRLAGLLFQARRRGVSHPSEIEKDFSELFLKVLSA